MNAWGVILMLSSAVSLSMLAWCVASAASEVTYVTLADGRMQERSLPVVFKLLIPFASNFEKILKKPFFAGQVKESAARLVKGGYEGVISAEEFVAIKLMLLWVLPEFWLQQAIRRRHTSIMKALPFVLDLLTLSVEAGMDFIGALQRNCKSRRLDPLNEELLRMTKEIQVGVSRKQALRNMAERVRQSDLSAVSFALIQADELGVSIGSILRIQSNELRSRRFDRAERLAAQAPVKMLFPLMICIFPAVFVILLGPVLGQALKGVW